MSNIESIPTIIAKRGFFSPVALDFLTAFKLGIKLTLNKMITTIPMKMLTIYHHHFYEYL